MPRTEFVDFYCTPSVWRMFWTKVYITKLLFAAVLSNQQTLFWSHIWTKYPIQKLLVLALLYLFAYHNMTTRVPQCQNAIYCRSISSHNVTTWPDRAVLAAKWPSVAIFSLAFCSMNKKITKWQRLMFFFDKWQRLMLKDKTTHAIPKQNFQVSRSAIYFDHLSIHMLLCHFKTWIQTLFV